MTTENIKNTVTYDDKVIAKIVGHALENIDGLLSVTGGFFSNVKGKLVNSDDVTAGVNVEVGKEEVATDLDVIVEYGKDIPSIAQSIKAIVAQNVEVMTHLKVVEVNVNVADIMTRQEFEEQSVTVQDRVEAGYAKTKEATAVGYEKAKEATAAGYEKAKEATAAGYEKAKEATAAGYERTKEVASAGYERSKEAAQNAGEYASEKASQAKEYTSQKTAQAKEYAADKKAEVQERREAKAAEKEANNDGNVTYVATSDADVVVVTD